MKTTTKKPATRRNGHQTLATIAPEIALRIALYARVSTDDQADRKTIEGQLEFLRNWARLYEFPIAGEYIDDGISGTIPLHDRPDGARLLQDAKAGGFGAVVVYRVDRLARSLRVLMDAHDELEEATVAIKSATEPFDSSTPLGKFLFQLLGSMAELDRATIIERMNLGRDRVTRDGRWLNGPIPLGYTLDAEGRLAPSERWVAALHMSEAQMIVDLFMRLAEGSTCGAEANRLNALGVPISRVYASGNIVESNGRWRPDRLTKLIRSDTYIGLHRYRSRFGMIERPVPPLVTREIWERANQQVTRNQHRPKGNAKRVYLLRGLIVCGTCGETFTGQTLHRPGRKAHIYYRCNSRSRTHLPPAERCRMRTIQAERLEEHVWMRVKQYSRHPGEALDEARRQLAARLEQTQTLVEQEKHLTQQLAEKHAKREEILTLLRRGKLTVDEVEREFDALEQESATLQQQRDALRTKTRVTAAIQEQYLRAEQMLARLQERVQEVERTNNQELKRQVMADVVEGIAVQEDTITVRFHFDSDCVADLPNNRTSSRHASSSAVNPNSIRMASYGASSSTYRLPQVGEGSRLVLSTIHN